MKEKTLESRILRVIEITEDYFGTGEVIFVGVKYDPITKIWVAKLKLLTSISIYESADNANTAIKKLKNRMKKIINRRDIV